MSSTPATKTSVLRRILFFLRFLEIRLRFIAILVITALVVGYWDTIQNYYDRWQRTREAEQAPVGTETTVGEWEYYCGMHPFVVRDHPDKCPICGMDLIQRKKGAPQVLPEGTLARVQVSPERVMQAGVQVEPVLYRMLTHTIRSYGIAEVAETRIAKIAARFSGRVEEMMVNAVGPVVKKGEPLARIYSPKYLAASQEYLRALGGQRQAGETSAPASPEDKKRADQLVEAARRRLLLAGFTPEQLTAVAEAGGVSDSVTLYSPLAGTVVEKNVLLGETVEEGTPLYTVADLSTLWVQVLLPEADIAAVTVGMPVEITSVAWPGVIFYGNVELVYPTLETENRTVKVRVAAANPEGKLKPGMYVNAAIRSPVGQFTLEESSKKAEASLTPALSQGERGQDASLPTATKEALAAPSLPTKTQEAADAFLAAVPAGAEYYVCPMDPQVVSDKLDDCPLCGMHLEKALKGDAPAAQGGGGAPPALAGILQSGSTEQWTEGYACAMHPDELSDKPGICRTCNCGMKMVKWRVERVLSIPESAVIDTGERKVVYVETASGVFDAKAVTLGRRAGDYYPVLDGLTLNERIVTRGSFLIDAEARLNPATSQSAVAGAGEPAKPAGAEHAGMAGM